MYVFKGRPRSGEKMDQNGWSQQTDAEAGLWVRGPGITDGTREVRRRGESGSHSCPEEAVGGAGGPGRACLRCPLNTQEELPARTRGLHR